MYGSIVLWCRWDDVAGEAQLRGRDAGGAERVPDGRGQGAGGHGHQAGDRRAGPGRRDRHGAARVQPARGPRRAGARARAPRRLRRRRPAAQILHRTCTGLTHHTHSPHHSFISFIVFLETVIVQNKI